MASFIKSRPAPVRVPRHEASRDVKLAGFAALDITGSSRAARLQQLIAIGASFLFNFKRQAEGRALQAVFAANNNLTRRITELDWPLEVNHISRIPHSIAMLRYTHALFWNHGIFTRLWAN